MKQLQEFIILSAELSTEDNLENAIRTERLAMMLEDLHLPFKVIEGVYKGTSEVSFMVTVKNESEYETVKDLGLKTFGQESVLFRNLHGLAFLVYGNGKLESIGRFQQVNDVEKEESYSVVDGNFWVCR